MVEKVVGVVVIERHGVVSKKRKFPLAWQGLYPLKEQGIRAAGKVGEKLFQFLSRQGVVRHMQQRGAYLHFAPSPYVRAVETAHYTSAKLAEMLAKNGVKVNASVRHGEPIQSLRFLEPYDFPHYPPAGSKADKKAVEDEEDWIRGKPVESMEPMQNVEKRTKAPARLLNLMRLRAGKNKETGKGEGQRNCSKDANSLC